MLYYLLIHSCILKRIVCPVHLTLHSFYDSFLQLVHPETVLRCEGDDHKDINFISKREDGWKDGVTQKEVYCSMNSHIKYWKSWF